MSVVITFSFSHDQSWMAFQFSEFIDIAAESLTSAALQHGLSIDGDFWICKMKNATCLNVNTASLGPFTASRSDRNLAFSRWNGLNMDTLQPLQQLRPPLNLSHHLSDTAVRRKASNIKKFYKYFLIPGIGQLAGGEF